MKKLIKESLLENENNLTVEIDLEYYDIKYNEYRISLTYEFFRQGELIKRNGLKIAPYYDVMPALVVDIMKTLYSKNGENVSITQIELSDEFDELLDNIYQYIENKTGFVFEDEVDEENEFPFDVDEVNLTFEVYYDGNNKFSII